MKRFFERKREALPSASEVRAARVSLSLEQTELICN